MFYHPAAPLSAGYSQWWWGVENKSVNIVIDTQGLRSDVTNLQATTGAAAMAQKGSNITSIIYTRSRFKPMQY
jgi:hypothetical protein